MTRLYLDTLVFVALLVALFALASQPLEPVDVHGIPCTVSLECVK